MRYMNQARKICCKKTPDVFIHRPLSIARQLLSGSMFKPGRQIHGKPYPTIKNSASELYPWYKWPPPNPQCYSDSTNGICTMTAMGNPIRQPYSRLFSIKVLEYDVSGNIMCRELLAHTRPVTALTFSPDSRHLVSGGRDGSLRVWSKNNEGRWQTSARLREHIDHIGIIEFSADGSYFVSKSHTKHTVWKRDLYNVWQSQSMDQEDNTCNICTIS